MFLEISQWDSSCRRIDEEGAALAPMIRDIGFEHVLKILEVTQHAPHSCRRALL